MTLRLPLSLAAFLASFAAASLAGVPLEHRFMWDEANAQMAVARAPADFLRAAGTYSKLAETGVRNGPLFYNLGTAFLQGGRYEDAQTFLLRAERYMGHDPDIRQNLRLAMAGGKKNVTMALPWYRFPLFWHYGIPGPARLTIAVWAFFCCWMALILGALGARLAARRLLILSVAVLILFGSSILTSLHEEAASRSTPNGQAKDKTGHAGTERVPPSSSAKP
jgi:hypothetical protein